MALSAEFVYLAARLARQWINAHLLGEQNALYASLVVPTES